jgi:hypothetical protein
LNIGRRCYPYDEHQLKNLNLDYLDESLININTFCPNARNIFEILLLETCQANIRKIYFSRILVEFLGQENAGISFFRRQFAILRRLLSEIRASERKCFDIWGLDRDKRKLAAFCYWMEEGRESQS